MSEKMKQFVEQLAEILTPRQIEAVSNLLYDNNIIDLNQYDELTNLIKQIYEQ